MKIIRIPTRVKNLEFKKRVAATEMKDRGTPNAVVNATIVPMGWFVHFEGSFESLYVGMEEPDWLKEGTEIDIIIAPRRKRA